MTAKAKGTRVQRHEISGGRRWRLTVLVGTTFLALLVAESVVRIFHLGPTNYTPRRIEPHGSIPFLRISDESFVFLPNSSFSSVYDPRGDLRGYFDPDGRVTYRINKYGFRSPDTTIEKPPGTYRVLCLGDSFTFGEGVRDDDVYPAQLEKILNSVMTDRRVEVINAGIGAHGTRHSVALFQQRCLDFAPDVVILGFFLNDATELTQTIVQHLASVTETQLSPLARVSRLYAIFERWRKSEEIRREYFETTRASFHSPEWERCKRSLQTMQRLAREWEFRFVVVVFPMLWQLDGDYPFEDIHALIEGTCRHNGSEYIDFLELYRGRTAASFWVHPTDHHPNEIAHRLAAQRIADHIIATR